MKNNKGCISSVVIGVLLSEGKILLTQRSDSSLEGETSFRGFWQFPGGGVEFGEDPEYSVVRELKEELGVNVSVVSFLPHIYTSVRKNWQGIFMVYICKMRSLKEQKIVLNDEATEYRWCSLSEIRKMSTFPLTSEIAEASFLQLGLL